MHSEVAKARARRAGLHARPKTDPDLKKAERDLAAAKASAHIEKILAAAPPLTDEQRIRLAELLKPAGEFARRQSVVQSRIAELDGGGGA